MNCPYDAQKLLLQGIRSIEVAGPRARCTSIVMHPNVYNLLIRRNPDMNHMFAPSLLREEIIRGMMGHLVGLEVFQKMWCNSDLIRFRGEKCFNGTQEMFEVVVVLNAFLRTRSEKVYHADHSIKFLVG